MLSVDSSLLLFCCRVVSVCGRVQNKVLVNYTRLCGSLLMLFTLKLRELNRMVNDMLNTLPSVGVAGSLFNYVASTTITL